MKSTIVWAVVYLLLGLACVVTAGETSHRVWRDALLIIGGILLGGLCAMATLLKTQLSNDDKK